MDTDLEPSATAALHRIQKRVVVLAAVHPVERAVVHRLDPVFDAQVRPLGELAQQIQHIIRHTIGPRSDRQTNDARVGERAQVQRPQAFDRRVGIGRWLEKYEMNRSTS